MIYFDVFLIPQLLIFFINQDPVSNIELHDKITLDLEEYSLNHNLSNNALIINGSSTVASPFIVTLSDFSFILPQDIASLV